MKNKYSLAYLLTGVFVVLLLAEIFTPKPTDWKESYTAEDKIPYGAYVLRETLPGLFPGQPVKTSAEPLVNYLTSDYGERKNLVFINGYLEMDEYEMHLLLDFVSAGNQVLLAAENFSTVIADSLGFETVSDWTLLQDSFTAIKLVNPRYQDSVYAIRKSPQAYYFSRIDSASSTILGVNGKGLPDFVRVAYGDGYFYLHSQPRMFTNINLLSRNNIHYVAGVFSHLPAAPVIWDEYYKAGRKYDRSVLRYILSTEALRWAWYILIYSALLYILFAGKRKQRIIPTIEPLQNTSLEFIDTVGRLYFQYRDHTDIARKKLTYFFQDVRQRFQLHYDAAEPELFAVQLAQRAGIDLQLAKDIVYFHQHTGAAKQTTEEELHFLYRKIDLYYKTTQKHRAT